MKITLLLFFTFLISIKSLAQDFSLDEVLKLTSISSKKIIDQFKQQSWKLIHTSTVYGNSVFTFEQANQKNKTKQYIQLTNKDSFNSLLFTVDEDRFNNLKSVTKKGGFNDFYFKEYPGSSDSAFLKDSSIVVIFRENSKTSGEVQYEVYITQFSSWLTEFMSQNSETRWSEKERYAFMLKCIGDQNAPAKFRDIVTACSCGGAVLEKNNNIEVILTLNRQQLIEYIKECFKKVNVEPN